MDQLAIVKKQVKKVDRLVTIKKDQERRRTLGRYKKGKHARIGHIGKTVVFETNDKKILTFSKMQRTVKGRWTSHARVGEKPKSQFLGP